VPWPTHGNLALIDTSDNIEVELIGAGEFAP
jgi:hypothetical protein